ncbi:DedA family protein [Falsochrobactrum ovis]|uniref:DedA family protein n=1 Tax=Falsochrobactrum ovis TaxID=1293442 RepID=UPI003621B5AF
MHYIEPYITAYGAFALFLIVYGESFGAPLPGESAVIASSLLALNGTLNIDAVLIAVFAGAVLGDCTGYLIGRIGGRRLILRFGHMIKLTPERLEHFEELFCPQRHLYGRNCALRGAVATAQRIIAGTLKMKPSHFLAANMVGAALWTLTWGLGPYLLSGVLMPVADYLKSLV